MRDVAFGRLGSGGPPQPQMVYRSAKSPGPLQRAGMHAYDNKTRERAGLRDDRSCSRVWFVCVEGVESKLGLTPKTYCLALWAFLPTKRQNPQTPPRPPNPVPTKAPHLWPACARRGRVLPLRDPARRERLSWCCFSKAAHTQECALECALADRWHRKEKLFVGSSLKGPSRAIKPANLKRKSKHRGPWPFASLLQPCLPQSRGQQATEGLQVREICDWLREGNVERPQVTAVWPCCVRSRAVRSQSSTSPRLVQPPEICYAFLPSTVSHCTHSLESARFRPCCWGYRAGLIAISRACALELLSLKPKNLQTAQSPPNQVLTSRFSARTLRVFCWMWAHGPLL